MEARTEQEYRVIVPARQATWAGGIDSLESIYGPLNRLEIWAQEEILNLPPFLAKKFGRWE
jgi:hypothetical protein